jgi:hypothetical protein
VCFSWISGFFSNHSLRATAATRLFSANVDEQLIKLKTGHTSDAVRSYKRVSEQQLSSMTDIIGCKKDKLEVSSNSIATTSCSPLPSKSGQISTTMCSPTFGETSREGFASSLFSDCTFSGNVNITINMK